MMCAHTYTPVHVQTLLSVKSVMNYRIGGAGQWHR